MTQPNTDYKKQKDEFQEVIKDTAEDFKTIYENGLFKAYWFGYERGKKEMLDSINEIKDES